MSYHTIGTIQRHFLKMVMRCSTGISLFVTDRFVTANKPDIVLVNQSTHRDIIVSITISLDDILVMAEKEKLSKYSNLTHEITKHVECRLYNNCCCCCLGQCFISEEFRATRIGWIQKAVLIEMARNCEEVSPGGRSLEP